MPQARSAHDTFGIPLTDARINALKCGHSDRAIPRSYNEEVLCYTFRSSIKYESAFVNSWNKLVHTRRSWVTLKNVR